ncbi:MAG: hypothetical protein IJX97_03440 [Clostridia bacterium]|nr:hypothetical protein [Clostridia bacterium]
MRKVIFTISSILCAMILALGLSSCKAPDTEPTTQPGPGNQSGNGEAQAIINGGFESADLSGWTVEYGNAFDDDCVSSKKSFMFDNDQNYNVLSINQTGNWYLTGKGYHGKYSGARVGAIRSGSFIVPDDGTVSLKLAGGALTVGKGTGAPQKAKERLCYVGFYLVENDKLIAMQTNEYFHEHTEEYIIPERYAAGVYNTDNFYEYYLDLSEYAGKEVYIRVVDNDESYYYGYIAVDDIRIGDGAEPQTEGEFFTKVVDYETEATAPSEYEIMNGGFELGSLAGWTVVEGDAFSNEGVNTESVWWNENIPYSRDGDYHYGKYMPSATGVMRSSEFVLSGSGYISYKLGGCSDNSKTYIRIMVVGEDGDTEVARYSNFKYWNYQFPYVQNGMRLLNMVQYYADLSAYLGETMYIEVVDNNASSEELGCITLDSVQTYWEEKPLWIDSESFFVEYESDIMLDSEYQVQNGGFENGNLDGWTLEGDKIGIVTNASGWWDQNFTYNKKGNFLFSGIVNEKEGVLEHHKGMLTSSAFTVGGSGYITYMLGGGGNPLECYISIIDAETGEELARFANRLFTDKGVGVINTGMITGGSNLANMVWYKADLSEFMGRSVKIRVVDNAASGWGLITVDSFVTYYKDASVVPAKANLAVDIKPEESDGILGENDPYQVTNGDFETGDLTGWTLETTNGTTDIGYVSGQDVFWKDANKPYNKDGSYLFTGVEDINGWMEGACGTLTSSAFTVGGCGFITFKLGGGYNAECYIEIVDATTNTAIAKYHNDNADSNEGRMFCFKADLTEFMGTNVYIRVVDNASEVWGCLAVDSFITHYESVEDMPEATLIESKI